MAKKLVKKFIPKGERLGWTPLNQVKSVSLSAVVVKGRRIRKNVAATVRAQQEMGASYLIP